MRFPTRQLRWLVALLVLAAIPISLVVLRPGRWDDCADPGALRDIGSIFDGRPAESQSLYRSPVFQRIEGSLSAGPGLHPLRYRVIRTDDPGRSFDQPTRFLKVPIDPERSVVRQVEASGESVPVHVAYAHLGDTIRLVASLYIYDGRAVDSLLPMQIRSALPQLARGRRPLTLLQVDGFGPPAVREQIENRAIAWLVSSWDAYREICAPPPAGASQG
jgi:hypothetical protein